MNMETYSITLYRSQPNHYGLDEFEEALRYSTLSYSAQHILSSGAVSEDDLRDALQRCMLVCRLAGISTAEHFKPLYVVDSGTGTIYTDWWMSKKGFSLLVTHLPLNEQTARWIWELTGV
jgi:hypothetical protein